MFSAASPATVRGSAADMLAVNDRSVSERVNSRGRLRLTATAATRSTMSPRHPLPLQAIPHQRKARESRRSVFQPRLVGQRGANGVLKGLKVACKRTNGPRDNQLLPRVKMGRV